MRSVSTLRPGEKGVIKRVDGHGAIRQRLLDMGILPNVTIKVERIAPAGGPIWVRLSNLQISLRRSEANAVLVTAE